MQSRQRGSVRQHGPAVLRGRGMLNPHRLLRRGRVRCERADLRPREPRNVWYPYPGKLRSVRRSRSVLLRRDVQRQQCRIVLHRFHVERVVLHRQRVQLVRSARMPRCDGNRCPNNGGTAGCCDNGACVPSGSTCPTGGTCGTPTASSCGGCGGLGETCCSGSVCTAGWSTCSGGFCVECGAPGSPGGCCMEATGGYCGQGFVCMPGSPNQCIPCGASGQACCAGGSCNSGAACNGSTCP